MKTPLLKLATINLFLFLSFITPVNGQEKATSVIPDHVFGEWHHTGNNHRFDGFLIHPGFIESGYKTFMYTTIENPEKDHYQISGKDINNNTITVQLHIRSRDTIEIKKENNTINTYIKAKTPKGGTYISKAEIPDMIKGEWYTTDLKNHLEFNITSDQLKFKDKTYSIEEAVLLDSGDKAQYRFVAKNKDEYWLFYFKNWSDGFLQIGFNGKYGDLYKAKKEYPNERIDDLDAFISSTFPKTLRGNWLKTDGSNLWSHSFYYNHAIIDKAKWDYKSVKKKGKWFVITLQNNGAEKMVYAKVNKDHTVSFGPSKKELTICSLTKTNDGGYKPPHDLPYTEENLFTIDSATYSGIIKGYNNKTDKKTGMIYVNNVFTGNQEPFLVKINDDGSFTIKFPLYYPQEIYVRFPENSSSIRVAPGKETWQLINSNKEDEGFFAGDCAQLNTDLSSLHKLRQGNRQYYQLVENIQNYTPDIYKEKCIAIYQSQAEILDSIMNERFISKKAKQVARLNLSYGLYENILSYDMYRRDKNAPKIDSTYLDFLNPEIYNNKLAAVAGSYSSFLNRIRFSNGIRGGKRIMIQHPEIIELAAILKNKGIELTEDEKELLELEKAYKKENAIALKKREDFNQSNEEILKKYRNKLTALIQKTPKDKHEDLFKSLKTDSYLIYAKEAGVTFSEEEIAIQKASRNLLNQEEQRKLTQYHQDEQLNKGKEAFYNKYQEHRRAYAMDLLKQEYIKQFHNFFKDKSTWMEDLLTMQTISGPINEELTPISDKSLQNYSGKIHDSYLKQYLNYENERTKAKIAVNQNNQGYTVHDTPTTEADKIFEAIISKYQGKVVYVDFWATWCAPCRSGIKRIKPLKEELKDKDIAFVYITNHTSPKTTWNNMIPEIKGEHYRVSEDEWNFLASKFNISGIPHYTLVDKQGTVVKTKISLGQSNDALKALFEKHL
ncbi:TlpA family protein disulfide reductase [Zhouia amylolytica]|uniref:Thioredoxin domain-containing protein n=1 Tax=Zhouia amylolytica AD3 TaxID=1286632 RepID=W2UKW1_9FLAO|nr:TlpA disulfide reductase family protein [Zhouia amylolytica]ETN93972.1 hypothetical protein P278_31040 [Zhouia amylolytica AD3]